MKRKKKLSERVLLYQTALNNNRRGYEEGNIPKWLYKEVNKELDQYMFLTKSKGGV